MQVCFFYIFLGTKNFLGDLVVFKIDIIDKNSHWYSEF